MASDSWRHPWTMLPDYMGPGTPVEQYQKQRADLVTNVAAPPPATQNAVAAAMTSGEGGANRGYPKATAPAADASATQSFTVPRRRDSTPYPGAPQPYQVDTTNARGNGPTASMPTINFNGAPAAPQGGAGMFSPQLQAKLDEYDAQADQLLSRRGIVDQLRGRQALKRRSRLANDASTMASVNVAKINADASTQAAQTNAFRASNDVPLAMLQSATQKYGVDRSAGVQTRGQDINADVAMMNDRTQQAIAEMTNATARRRDDFGLMANGRAVAEGAIMGRAAGGSLDDVEATATALSGRRELADKLPTFQQTADGSGVYTNEGGTVKYRPRDAVMSKEDRAEAARKVLANR